ncbi:MAG: hypothetical protein ACLGIK_07260, partial [Gemmatimonadota bacterium]
MQIARAMAFALAAAAGSACARSTTAAGSTGTALPATAARGVSHFTILHFNDVYVPQKWGSWGALEYQDQDPATAPKYQALVDAAADAGVEAQTGLVASVDVFYNTDDDYASRWKARGVLAFEMEASALFFLAARAGVQAACA